MLFGFSVLATYCSQAANGHIQVYIMCVKYERNKMFADIRFISGNNT